MDDRLGEVVIVPKNAQGRSGEQQAPCFYWRQPDPTHGKYAQNFSMGNEDHITAACADAADDLVQDTLERAWNKMHLWRPGSDMRAWLFAIMHNVFVNHARSRRHEIESTMEVLPPLPVRATQGDHLELLDVQRALATLPAEQRIVLERAGLIDPDSIDDYIIHDGYQALAKASPTLMPSTAADKMPPA